MTRLAVVATHPIQYQIPWFQKLSQVSGVDLTVYYAILPDAVQQGKGFDVPFQWDIPLLEGYHWKTISNIAKSPGLQGFFSTDCPAISETLATDKHDAVIVTGWNSRVLLQTLRACHKLHIPAIVRGESNSLRRRRIPKRLLHRLLLSRYQAFLSIGEANRNFYLQYGVSADQIFPCRYFVDNSRFRAQFEVLRPQKTDLRITWGIPPNSFCVLFAGKLEAKKRILDLIRAIDLARKTIPEIHLLIAGTGELGESARELAESLKAPVTFVGFLNQTEIARAYSAADVLVLPSDYGETWGLVVNEGMVCQLPAIVSDRVGCGPDLVQEGVTGYTFRFGDVEDLARKIVLVASDSHRRNDMGKTAWERVQGYSVESAVEGTLNALNFVVTRGRRPVHVWLPGLSEEGGIQLYCRTFLASLVEERTGLNTVVFLKNDKNADGMIKSEVLFHSLGRWPRIFRTLAFGTFAFLNAVVSRPTLIIVGHPNFGSLARLCHYVSKIPYWVLAYGIDVWDTKRQSVHTGFQHADRIIAISSFTAERILRDPRISHDRVPLLHPAVDPMKYGIAKKPVDLLTRFGFDQNTRIVLTVCRLAGVERYKGYDRVLEAFPRILKEIPDTHYLIVGKGEDENRLREMAISMGIEKSVHLVGFVPESDLPDFYHLCDVFAMPSKKEGFGIVYLEALACGKPVLAGNKDGAQDALCHGELGVLVDPDNVAELAETLIRILKGTYPHPILYQPEELRRRAIEKFGKDRFDQTLGTYLKNFFSNEINVQ